MSARSGSIEVNALERPVRLEWIQKGMAMASRAPIQSIIRLRMGPLRHQRLIDCLVVATIADFGFHLKAVPTRVAESVISERILGKKDKGDRL